MRAGECAWWQLFSSLVLTHVIALTRLTPTQDFTDISIHTHEIPTMRLSSEHISPALQDISIHLHLALKLSRTFPLCPSQMTPTLASRVPSFALISDSSFSR